MFIRYQISDQHQIEECGLVRVNSNVRKRQSNLKNKFADIDCMRSAIILQASKRQSVMITDDLTRRI